MTEKELLEFVEYLETSHAITIVWKERALKRLVKEYAVEHSVHADKRVCACETVYVEYLKDDAWHCGFCKLPLAGNA